jgi:hypothetical protein
MHSKKADVTDAVLCSFAIAAGSFEGFYIKHADLVPVIYHSVFGMDKPQECVVDHFLYLNVANSPCRKTDVMHFMFQVAILFSLQRTHVYYSSYPHTSCHIMS